MVFPLKATRALDGVDDIVTFPKPAYFGGSHTIAAVVKRDNLSDYHGVFTIATPTTTSPYICLEFTNDGGIEYVAGGAHAKEYAHNWGSTAWMLVVATYTRVDASTGTVRFHAFDGSTWFHGGPTAFVGGSAISPANWNSDTTANLRFGNWDNTYNHLPGKVAVEALWSGVALSDAQIEGLAGGSASDWIAAGANHLWELSQPSLAFAAQDQVGNLDELGTVGTAVSTDVPPATLYGRPGGMRVKTAGSFVDLATGPKGDPGPQGVKGDPGSVTPGAVTVTFQNGYGDYLAEGAPFVPFTAKYLDRVLYISGVIDTSGATASASGTVICQLGPTAPAPAAGKLVPVVGQFGSALQALNYDENRNLVVSGSLAGSYIRLASGFYVP